MYKVWECVCVWRACVRACVCIVLAYVNIRKDRSFAIHASPVLYMYSVHLPIVVIPAYAFLLNVSLLYMDCWSAHDPKVRVWDNIMICIILWYVYYVQCVRVCVCGVLAFVRACVLCLRMCIYVKIARLRYMRHPYCIRYPVYINTLCPASRWQLFSFLFTYVFQNTPLLKQH